MESVHDEIKMMRTFIRHKRDERAEFLRKRLSEAREDFQHILHMIITDFKPERVYQWGSLVDGKTFQEISDIDLAVTGITEPKTFFKLYAQAKELTSFPLHIVQIEYVDPPYAQEIITQGVVVYERPV